MPTFPTSRLPGRVRQNGDHSPSGLRYALNETDRQSAADRTGRSSGKHCRQSFREYNNRLGGQERMFVQRGQKAMALSTAFCLFLSACASSAYAWPSPAPQTFETNEQSATQAAAAYRQAAEAGDVRAMYELGIIYQSGNGLSQSYADALKWYSAALQNGFEPAKIALGILYQNGWGVAQDLAKANTFYVSAEKSEIPRVASAAKELGILVRGIVFFPPNHTCIVQLSGLS
jgi:hypothetical protein